MLMIRIAAQQDARTTTTGRQSTTERPERPERPEQPERPERAERPEAVVVHPTKGELKDQIKATIQAAQEAEREARNIQIEQGQVNMPPGFPGHTIQNPRYGNNDIPEQVVPIANGFFMMCAVMVVGWPLARAFGRRMERGTHVAAIPAGMTDQLQRIEQAVDAMSIEVERISESQRFLAKLQSGQSAESVALPGAERR